MIWQPTTILFNYELEGLQLISDHRGWATVAEIYLNKKLKQKLLHNALVSAIIVDKFLESMYVDKSMDEN